MIEVVDAFFGTVTVNGITTDTLTVQVKGNGEGNTSLVAAISAAEAYAESFIDTGQRLWVPLTDDTPAVHVDHEILSVTWFVV